MDIYTSLPYPTGNLPANPGPLVRFLPPVPIGVAPDFLAKHAGPGAWVLDPFGASPLLALEMARLGYRVLAAVNNPIGRFLFEMGAAAYPQSEFQAALAELASSRKGEERMEAHLQSIYLTECTKCSRSVPAQAFIWEKNGKILTSRIYACSACNEQGEYPATEADQQRAAQMDAVVGLHRSRALERVATRDDPDREHVEEALQYYLPRAVYALITVINKIDSLNLSPERRRCLQALVLTACDEANTLWGYPEDRPRPKQLTVPPRFRENNVWMALERGVEIWSLGGDPIPISIWPELPPESGGICLFEGPLRDLAPGLKQTPIQAVLTALPRPNQAFWTLSALWSGWLWGREAVAPFKMVLRRRRYDWHWHASALQAALKSLSPHLPLQAPLFAIIAEPEPSYISAAMLASDSAGFDLNGVALRTPHDPAYLLWHRRAFTHQPAAGVRPDETSEPRSGDAEATPEPTLPGTIRDAFHTYLEQRSEPATYLHLHTAGLTALAERHLLDWQDEGFANLHAPLVEALKGAAFIHHGGTDNPETGLWGLPALESESDPLPDAAERILVNHLVHHPTSSLDELETTLYSELRGLLTPPLSTTLAILDSYAIENEGRYSLRPEDTPSARLADLDAAGKILARIGKRLGYTPQWGQNGDRLLLWEEKGRYVHAFYLLASALSCKVLRANQHPTEICLLVIPGGRAGLLAHKLERDPVIKHIWESGWRLLKYRQLRKLADTSNLTLDNWASLLAADPLTQPEQMRLF